MNFKLLKTLILAALLALPAGESYAAGSSTIPCRIEAGGKQITVDSGCSMVVKSGGALNLNAGSTESNQATKTSGGSTDVSGIVFSTAITGNPLTQLSYTDTLVSTSLNSTTMATILASTAGKTIYPMNPTLMVSGTGATATGLALECSDGTLIASWPIAELVNAVPVGTYVSTAGPALGAGLGKGCPASTALMLSDIGSTITTTTHVYTKINYTVQ